MTGDAAGRAPACPSCHATAWRDVGGDSYALHRCASCGCYRIQPATKRLAELYDGYYSEDSAQRLSGPFDLIWTWKRRSRARLIARHAPPHARVCDVGCERGELLNVLKQSDCRVVGTQLSRTAADFAKKRFGIDVWVGELADAPFASDAFDAVVMLNVLEHLPDPEFYVAQVARMLPSGSVFWIEIPNAGSFTARVTGRNWLHHDPPHHRWAFDVPGITRLVDRHGFTIDHIYSHNWEHGPIGCLQSWLNFLPGPKNLVFDVVRRGLSRDASRLARELLHVALGGLLLPFAVLVAFGEGLRGNGQVILIRARKT